jgi:hypothetical protein
MTATRIPSDVLPATPSFAPWETGAKVKYYFLKYFCCCCCQDASPADFECTWEKVEEGIDTCLCV